MGYRIIFRNFSFIICSFIPYYPKFTIKLNATITFEKDISTSFTNDISNITIIISVYICIFLNIRIFELWQFRFNFRKLLTIIRILPDTSFSKNFFYCLKFRCFLVIFKLSYNISYATKFRSSFDSKIKHLFTCWARQVVNCEVLHKFFNYFLWSHSLITLS